MGPAITYLTLITTESLFGSKCRVVHSTVPMLPVSDVYDSIRDSDVRGVLDLPAEAG